MYAVCMVIHATHRYVYVHSIIVYSMHDTIYHVAVDVNRVVVRYSIPFTVCIV